MMLRPTFRSARLIFGSHDAVFRFPEDRRPVVLAGPNGSGKSTLVEGVVRTLFGYEKRRSGDAAALEARRPWNGGAMAGEVTFEVRGEIARIRRDFTTDRVTVTDPRGGVVHFEGDGNPGASNQEARHYRRILTDLFGIGELDAYQRTLYIRQGDLPETTVGEHLLRLAAGGHSRVDGARRDIAEAHRGVTRRPIHPSARAAINARDLEKLDEEIEALTARLDAASEAGERRGPISLERDRVADRLAALDDEIRFLEDARASLASASAVEMEVRQLREWSRKLDRVTERLRRAGDESSAADAALREIIRGGRYPDDLPERLAAAELRWRDIEGLSAGPPQWPALAGMLALAAAVALWFLGEPLLVAAAVVVGALGVVAWVALRLDTDRRRGSARDEMVALLQGVPGPAALDPSSRGRLSARYRAQRSADARRAAARSELAVVAREARSLLREIRAGGFGALAPAALSPASDSAEEAGASPSARSAGLEFRIRSAAAAARDRLARTRTDLDRVGEISLGLPDGVPPRESDVASALAERRKERARLQVEVQELGQELLEKGSPAESVAALRAALEDRIPRREALERKARALEAAHALIADAYDGFRARDQERLLDHVSAHADALTGGAVGPVVVSGSLEAAAVRMRERSLPLASPPLSFGELHALLLAVRLGAADFLGAVGILPPLIVDEPFAHLDTRRAATVWKILCHVAAERQVIVTTQDELLLEHLEITPDLRLEASV